MNGTDLLWLTLLRLGAFLILTATIVGGVAAFHHHIAYWAASLISFAVVFFGVYIYDGDWFE